MSQEEKDPRVEMVNEIIFLNKIATEMWQYHPHNPDRTEVEVEYKAVNDKIAELQAKIAELDK